MHQTGEFSVERKRHIARTMRWFRRELGWTRSRLSDEVGADVAAFENGATDNSIVTPCFQARFGISIESIAAWRHYLLIGTRPPRGARGVIDGFRERTVQIIEEERS